MAKRISKAHRLNADQLGEKGELRFRSLCTDAQLICNKSDRDRTGWDFIVEFPFISNPGDVTLDKRSAPISCHFQQKTMWDTSDAFQMRLSSAERIAKELKPSFIYVLKVNDQLEFVSAFLIHLLNDPLTVILKRLRAEEAKNTGAKINTKFISMRASKVGLPIEPTGEALRAALTKLCGPDLHRYTEHKESQLKGLGFGQSAYTTTMTFHLDNPGELVDAFLGLKTDIPISDVKTFETRFGIELPAGPNFAGKGRLTLDPKPVDHCVVTYRRQLLSRPAVFDGTVVLPPPFVTAPGKPAALIRTEFFNMRYADSAFAFKTHPEVFETLRCPLRHWRNFFEMSHGLAEGQGEFQIKIDSFKNVLTLPPVGRNFKGLDPNFYSFFVEVSKSLANILEAVGFNDELRLTFTDLRAEAGQIRGIDALLKGDVEKVDSITLSSPMPAEPLQLPITIKMAYVNFLPIGTLTIGYATKANMSATQVGETIEWRSTSLNPFDIRLLDNSSDHFQRYAQEMQRAMGADGLMKPDHSAETEVGIAETAL
jgi:hypothetical protein